MKTNRKQTTLWNAAQREAFKTAVIDVLHNEGYNHSQVELCAKAQTLMLKRLGSAAPARRNLIGGNIPKSIILPLIEAARHNKAYGKVESDAVAREKINRAIQEDRPAHQKMTMPATSGMMKIELSMDGLISSILGMPSSTLLDISQHLLKELNERQKAEEAARQENPA